VGSAIDADTKLIPSWFVGRRDSDAAIIFMDDLPVALFAMYYNFVRIHKALRTTPAMAAKVTERLWEMGNIVDVLEAWEASN
jgi:hypothetical protein